MKECFYCKEKIKGVNPHHSKNCKPYQDKVASVTKEMLEDMYCNQGMSCVEIAEVLGFDGFSRVYKLMDECGLDRRSLKEACAQERRNQRHDDTHLERYGCTHNFCKESENRKQWEKRLFEEEGITNVFQRESVKEKSVNTIIEKYGVEHIGQANLSRGESVYTKLNKRVANILTESGVDFGIELKIKNPGNRYYYAFDFVITGTNKIIEANGDYWHGNPVLYKSNDIILKGSSGEMTVQQKWDYDKNKAKVAIDAGYQILVVWEYDLNDDFENTKNRILAYAKGQD